LFFAQSTLVVSTSGLKSILPNSNFSGNALFIALVRPFIPFIKPFNKLLNTFLIPLKTEIKATCIANQATFADCENNCRSNHALTIKFATVCIAN